MKFSEIPNIWSVDLSELSNADIGRIYYERAKQVINEAMLNPSLFRTAVNGNRFRRDYLVAKVGCKASVATQNPRVRKLLVETDEQITQRIKYKTNSRSSLPKEDDFQELREQIKTLQHQVEQHAALLRKLLLKFEEK